MRVLGRTLEVVFRIYSKKSFKTRPNSPYGGETSSYSLLQVGVTCLTTDEPDSLVRNAPCQFPWKLGGKTYDSCTTDEDPNGRLWCATKLDESGSFILGQYGYCSEECTKKDETGSITDNNYDCDSSSGTCLPTENCGDYIGRNITHSYLADDTHINYVHFNHRRGIHYWWRKSKNW